MFAETRRQNLFTLNRQYPLPDIHIDTLAKIESGVRTILAQEEMTQSDFEKFGINMLLLLGGSQDFAWQHAQVTNPGGIELGDPVEQGAVERGQLFGGRLRVHRRQDGPISSRSE